MLHQTVKSQKGVRGRGEMSAEIPKYKIGAKRLYPGSEVGGR